MDPLSVTASIIAIVQLTSVIIGCLNDLKGTSKDRAQCAMEISNVSNLLVQLMYRLNEGPSNDSSYAALQALAAAEGPIDQYRSALEQLKSKFTSTASSGLKIGNALSWKFSKEEIANILSRIERLKSLTQIALEIDHFKLSQEIKNDTTASTSGVKSMQESQDSEQYRVTMDWLSSTNFPAQQSDIISKRKEGTGNWFLESPEFTKFLQGTKQTLFCPGIPGAGKTMISAIAVDHICKAFEGDNVGVAYIYNNYNRQEQQTATKMVAAILKQLAQGRPLYGEAVTALHKQYANVGTRPSHEEICTSLESVLCGYSKVYVIIDALDEYTDSDSMRSELITILHSVQTSTNTSLMVTSRFNSGTEKLFQGALRLEIQANETDVKEYVIGRLDRFPKCVRNDKELQAEIQDGIVLAVDRMFLLAPLHLDSLEDEITKKAIRLGLKNLPRGSTAVNETYDQAIRRIERQPLKRSARAKTVLSWITYAERQLTTTELCHALAVEEGDLELDEDNIPDIEDITSVCAGLVEVDKESNVIRLVHYTTQEYFKDIREAWNPKAQEEIASTCLTYLSFETFSAGHCNNDADFRSRLRQNPFLGYAARYWGNHALPVQEAIKELALAFLRNMIQTSCSTQVMLVGDFGWLRGYSQRTTKDFTGLHLAVVFKLTYLLQELICSNGNESCININSKDSNGKTPLSWAAEKGQEAVVTLLLKQDDVIADTKDNSGRTPLSWAARWGQEAAVKLLLEQDDVIADSRDNNGRTPLSWAARQGYEAVVKLLLEQDDVIANSKDDDGRTPLLWAAREGHEAIVKLLLEQDDVIADLKDDDGRTPLLWAARLGQEAVVKLLLEKDDVIANSMDKYGQTPLSWAAREGHEAVVKLLLKQDDVIADLKDDDGRTPLSWAAENGDEVVVKLLIKQDDVIADSKDDYGRTPLQWAAENGHEAVVKLLLKQDDVIANSKDNNGRTPLLWAARMGQEAVVKLLLKQDVIIADSKDNSGRTPLLWAAREGHKAVVRLLLEQDNVIANLKDYDGRTLLLWAVENGQEKVVKLLLKQDNVIADSKDNDGRTPLSRAAENGQEEVVKLLLEQDDVIADLKDNSGRTPLSRAAERGRAVVVKLLLKQDVIADSKDNSSRTPLSWAAEGGREAVVKLLIERDDVDANSEDKGGCTPLWWAANSDRYVEESSQEPLVKLLLDRDIIPDSKNKDGRTPLSIAAGRAHKTIVKLLLERNDVDPNSEDKDGHTPLWWATEGDDYIRLPYRRWGDSTEKRNEQKANKRKEIEILLTDKLAKGKEVS